MAEDSRECHQEARRYQQVCGSHGHVGGISFGVELRESKGGVREAGVLGQVQLAPIF